MISCSMPVMFVGPTVGLITSYDSYKDILIPIVVISLATTVLTMAVSGLTTQVCYTVDKRGL